MLVSIIYPCCTIFSNCNTFTLPIFKQKSITSFMVSFSLSCCMFLYSVEKSKAETEEALFVLFDLFIKIILD